MAEKLDVALVTPEKQVARIQVDMVTAPSVLGEVGILPNHRPLLADLQEGVVGFRADGRVENYCVSGGFLEVDRNQVTILAETAEHASEIDSERAQQALKDACTKVKALDVDDPQYQEQTARMKRAQVRLSVLGK